MPKTAVFTTITPLPAGITRKSVIDMYHEHLAMIDLNPLVVERFKCKPPSYAPMDEYYLSWYTIKDKISYLPGKLAQSSVSYHACFQDLDDGLQTHVYAPLGLRIRAKWSVGGSLPGEPRDPSRFDPRVPVNGLYICEDVKMTCSSLLLGFIKKTFQDSHGTLVEKLLERAHVLESNFANERLKALRNVAPRDRAGHGNIFIAPPPDYEPKPPPRYTPHSRSKSAGSILFQPEYTPQYMSHGRSHSETPLLSPDLSYSSSISEESTLESSPRRPDRPITFTFTFEETSLPSPTTAPEEDLFLLPASTYNSSSRQEEEEEEEEEEEKEEYKYDNNDNDDDDNRLSYSDFTTPQDIKFDRMISLYPQSPRNQREEDGRVSLYPGYPPYKVEERATSFNFAFDQKPTSASAPEQSLLAEIDAAIDDVFSFNLPVTTYDTEWSAATVDSLLPSTKYDAKLAATTYEPTLAAKTYTSTLPAKTYTSTLPSTTYNATLPTTAYKSDATLLPASTYVPKQQWFERKDSVMPQHVYEELPPVPPKDEKYRRPSELHIGKAVRREG